MSQSISFRSLALLVILSFIWATLFVAVKIGDQSLSPLTLMFDRAAIATIILLPLACFSYRKHLASGASIRWQDLACSAVVGLLIAYMWVVIAVAETTLSSGIAALLTSSIYVFSWMLSVIVVRQKQFHVRHLIGVVVATLGLAAAIGLSHWMKQGAQVGAAVLFISGFLAFAIAGLLTKKYSDTLPAMIVTPLNLLFTTLALALIGLLHLMPWHQSYAALPMLSVLWAGIISTAIGYCLYYYLMKREGPLFSNCFGYLVPVFGLLLGMVLMKNTISVLQLVGLPVLLYGIYLTQTLSKQ